MASMSPRLAVAVLVLGRGLVACSVGDGVGEAKGTIVAEECGLDGDFDLDPDYFAADSFEDRLLITVQRGGDYQVKSDGLLFDVPDMERVDEHLGEPLDVRYDPDATLEELQEFCRVALYLNETCDKDDPVGLACTVGSVTFTSIGGGDIDEGDRIDAEFAIDFEETSEREAAGHLEGFFRFRYTRGRPAQRFP